MVTTLSVLEVISVFATTWATTGLCPRLCADSTESPLAAKIEGFRCLGLPDFQD